ncbi:hypothetical protein NLU13_1961 [Sarocladium strictum]|uniref:PinX1-related protein 1 n=1 Tax=Sarocladium strictum TaxID=5046 RepID=A0AA39GS70_SARSR|nr:hypothetical protein NLU13_1961 [Sarocladium strictum]
MGLLAESKRSSKISKDPNNTKWTKNQNSFGQKIMRSQGWEPGQYLGAHDAAHAESYTAANASYIRVTLKDDMKGLGFHKAKEDQVTGLDVFSDLLSRLNGKSEAEVEDGRQARMAVKANLYVEQKWGPMRFVRGGLLVGDKLESLGDEAADKDASSSDEASQEEKRKKSKKRKAAEAEDNDEERDEEESEAARRKRRKAERKLKKAMEKADDGTVAIEDDETKSGKKSKKSKKAKKNKSDDDSDDDTPVEETKAERKERKREKKERKRKRREAREAESDATTSATASALPSGVSTPTGTGTSTPVRASRNFVRSRFIAQKKEALLDAKALNQIFMVKA